MSSLSEATVFRISALENHPNADTLEITEAFGCPVIVKKGQYKVGDLAVFICEDLICPDTPQFEFLGKHKRIKACKLRGVFSMGILVPALPHHSEGDVVTEELGITKYEPPMEGCAYGGSFKLGKADTVKPPYWQVCYTNIDSLRKFKELLEVDEEVVLTEKLHGCNGRYVYQEGKLHIGSHHRWIDPEDDTVWNRVAKQLDIEAKLKDIPNRIVFGEIFGHVQKNYPYGCGKHEYDFKVFDVFDMEHGRYLDYDNCVIFCEHWGFTSVPVLYRGPWKGYDEMRTFSDGNSTLAEHTREGFVVRPVMERWDRRVGRVIFKLHGEAFLLNKK